MSKPSAMVRLQDALDLFQGDDTAGPKPSAIRAKLETLPIVAPGSLREPVKARIHYDTICSSGGVPVMIVRSGYECPVCGCEDVQNYCPNCGACMSYAEPTAVTEREEEIRVAVESLNFYRNQYYAESVTTEQGRTAQDINTILPLFVRMLGLEEEETENT